jgi:hypothetical protein
MRTMPVQGVIRLLRALDIGRACVRIALDGCQMMFMSEGGNHPENVWDVHERGKRDMRVFSMSLRSGIVSRTAFMF